jgi:PAS domain S-box-containing protein
MLSINQPIDLPHLDRVIDYDPPIVTPDTTAIAAITCMDRSRGNTTLSEIESAPASTNLPRNGSSYVLVVAGSRPIGILTARDVVRLAVAGINLAEVKVIEVMTQPVITLSQINAHDILTVLSFLRQQQIGHLPIVDEAGLLVGMVAERDLLQQFDPLELAISLPASPASPQPELASKLAEVVRGASLKEDRSPQQAAAHAAALVDTNWQLQQAIDLYQQTEATLRQSQQDLIDFVENAIVGLHWVAGDGTIIWANQAELDLLGYTREEYIGHSITEFHVDRATIEDILDRLLNNRPVQEYGADLRCKDGSIRHVSIDSNSSWRNGEFVRTRCFTRDITERKQAEDELKRFNHALSHAMEGIALLDPQGRYVHANQAYAQAIGYSPEAMVGMDWQRTVHPDDLASVQLAYQYMLQHGKVDVSARGVRIDGSIFYKQLVMVTNYDSQQQPIGHYCFMKDISLAKQAEAALVQSEQKFRAIFDSMFQFIGMLNPDGTIMEANRTALDAVAADRADVIGKPFWDTPWWSHSPQLQAQVKQAIKRAANGELVQFESEHIWADGSPAFVDFSLKPVVDAAGKVMMLIPEGRDITERKRAAIQLQEREALLSSIYDGAEQAVFVVDVIDRGDFCYANFNPVSERYAGVTNSQIQGKTPEQAFGNEMGTALRQNYIRCLEAGTSIKYEEQLAFEGHTIWTLTTLSPLRDQQGRIHRIVGTATDISDRQQIEEELRSSEQRLQAMLDNSTAVIYMKDIQGRYMTINRSYEVLFHLDRNQVKGKTDQDIFPAEIADIFQANDRAVIAAGVALEKEEVAPQDDGLHTYLSIKFPLFDAEGKIYAVCGMSTDISDRQHREEMLRNISLGVATKTDKFLFQALAEYLTKTLGVEYAFISESIPPDGDRVRTIAGYGDGRVLENFEYALANTPCEQVVGKQLCVYPDRVQQQFPLDTYLQDINAESFIGAPLFDSTGRVLGLIAVLSHQPCRDPDLMAEILNIFAVRAAAEIERQQAEVALHNQKQELARSNDELQQFAYVASHDLQEPLRMITSYLELLERRYKGQLDAKADTFIAYAVDGATRMQILINDLLSYSRVGTQKQNFQAVDCTKIVQNVLTNLQVTIAQNNAVITYAPLPQVNADPSQLTQLFQNLIGNAIKFRSEEPPQIQIGAEYTDDKWLFSVEDNGIGMESQYLDRIFIIFQRLHGKTEYPGTGIGLAVCKKIVERHGGSLWVESQPGRGSTFHFSLPPLASNL